MTERSVDRWLAQAARSPFPGGRVILLAVLFGVVLCALGGFLAWRSYQSRVEQAESLLQDALASGARLDATEAPTREMVRRLSEELTRRQRDEQSRIDNKSAFTP